jgi:hypothetical protein
MIWDPVLTMFGIALILNEADSKIKSNRIKIRPQDVDSFCLNPN